MTMIMTNRKRQWRPTITRKPSNHANRIESKERSSNVTSSIM